MMASLLEDLGSIIQNGSWFAFPLCFLGGVISSASPCVLAMIPLAIGFVGGYSGNSPKKALRYSLVFTFGLTFTFTLLGVIAGFMGRLFGDVGAFWKYAVPVIAILLGIQLIGFFEFKLSMPQRFLPRRKDLFGAFLMGLLFGILATPCATPVLAAIMTFAASKKDIAYSGGLLLSYALGHWVLVLGAGISVGFAQKVMESRGINSAASYSKKAAGIILIAVGIYLLIGAF